MQSFRAIFILGFSLSLAMIFGFRANSNQCNRLNNHNQLLRNCRNFRFKASWSVVEDSSEIECESSSSLAAKRAAQEKAITEKRVAAELAAKLAADIERKTAEEEGATLKLQRKAVVSVPVSESKSVDKQTVQTGFSPNQNSAFDVGLLIAFPLMIGTLGFFLFFPLIAEKLVNTVP